MGLATSICFGSQVGATDILTLLIKASARSQFIEDTVVPSYLPGIISLFIMCIRIIRNNSLVDGRARAESNPSHWARHALLHMAADCVNRSATKAGHRLIAFLCTFYTIYTGFAIINVTWVKFYSSQPAKKWGAKLWCGWAKHRGGGPAALRPLTLTTEYNIVKLHDCV